MQRIWRIATTRTWYRTPAQTWAPIAQANGRPLWRTPTNFWTTTWSITTWSTIIWSTTICSATTWSITSTIFYPVSYTITRWTIIWSTISSQTTTRCTRSTVNRRFFSFSLLLREREASLLFGSFKAPLNSSQFNDSVRPAVCKKSFVCSQGSKHVCVFVKRRGKILDDLCVLHIGTPCVTPGVRPNQKDKKPVHYWDDNLSCK